MPPSGGFLALIKRYLNHNDKRMSIMPFLPRTMPPSRQVTLELRIVNKPHGTTWRDVHEMSEDREMQPAKEDDNEINVGNEDLRIRCMLDDSPVLEEIVDSNRVMARNKFTVYFVLDFAGRADDSLVTLSLKTANDEMEIRFITHFVHTAGIDDSEYDVETPLFTSDPRRSSIPTGDRKWQKASEDSMPDQDRLLEAFEAAKKFGESQLKRGRIMFVGAPRAGKTSLLKRLIGEGYDRRKLGQFNCNVMRR